MRSYTILISFFFFAQVSFGQDISKNELPSVTDNPRSKAIGQFYELNNYHFFWLPGSRMQKALLADIHQAGSLALNENDYLINQPGYVNTGEGLMSREDSIRTELWFTDAALHLFSEVKNGNLVPPFGYNGLGYVPSINNLPEQIIKAFRDGRSAGLVKELQPNTKAYREGLALFQRFRESLSAADFKNVQISSAKTDSSNKALLQRLYQLGVTDTLYSRPTKKEVVALVRRGQKRFDLSTDGSLRPATMAAFNIPLEQRADELKTAINYFRWMHDIMDNASVLILNIPSAGFDVYEKSMLLLHSRVITGKPSTPTPTLTSTIKEVILYPYWTVPKNIATREMLPIIKRNVNYLAQGNFQVLNIQGKVVDPASINWHSLGSSNFPYTIRQSTGCDNSLGLVKFNLYNPFTVYLHDTPSKMLFASARRFYSHGCMRVEKPVDLAHLVLGQNRMAIDTLTEKGCLEHQSPVVVAVSKPLPVIVLYSTVWYDEQDSIVFYDDIYKRMPWIPRK